jgi:hypothetical protein
MIAPGDKVSVEYSQVFNSSKQTAEACLTVLVVGSNQLNIRRDLVKPRKYPQVTR